MITTLVTQILNGGLIETNGVFELSTGDPFVVFVTPTNASNDAAVVVVPSAAYSGVYTATEKGDIPLVVNQWNEFLFTSLDVSELTGYTVYWGATKLSNQ